MHPDCDNTEPQVSMDVVGQGEGEDEANAQCLRVGQPVKVQSSVDIQTGVEGKDIGFSESIGCEGLGPNQQIKDKIKRVITWKNTPKPEGAQALSEHPLKADADMSSHGAG